MWQARKNVNDTRNGNTRNDNNRHTCITRVALCNVIYTMHLMINEDDATSSPSQPVHCKFLK